MITNQHRTGIAAQGQCNNYIPAGLFDAEPELSPRLPLAGPWSPTISVIGHPLHIQELETHHVYSVHSMYG